MKNTKGNMFYFCYHPDLEPTKLGLTSLGEREGLIKSWDITYDTNNRPTLTRGKNLTVNGKIFELNAADAAILEKMHPYSTIYRVVHGKENLFECLILIIK